MKRVSRLLGVDGSRLGSGGLLLRRALARREQALGSAMKPYHERFPVGASVRIAERAELERFRREWQFHHKLEAEQLS